MTGKAPSRRWSYVAAPLSLLLLGAGILTRLSCASRPDAQVRSAESETGAPSTQGALIAPALSDPEPPVPGVQPTAPAAAADSQANSASAPVIPHVDARELPLLANIERELKRDPPPEVHALLAEYRRGADREALIEHVQHKFPKDLSLRVITLRWIDDVRPGPGQTGGTRPLAPEPGMGVGWVKPIQKRER